MRRIIAVEPGEWIILPCILEDDDCYRRVDVYPDGYSLVRQSGEGIAALATVLLE